MTKTGLRVRFEDHDYGGNLGLGVLCPGCGSPNLHHHRVEIYDRDTEDAETGRRVVVESSEVSVTGNMQDNPSPRRDGMRIAFWCEICYILSELTIVQHKGTTYLAMNITGEDEDRRNAAIEATSA